MNTKGSQVNKVSLMAKLDLCGPWISRRR